MPDHKRKREKKWKKYTLLYNITVIKKLFYVMYQVIGFFDDKIKSCNNCKNKTSEEINEKNIFDYSYTACAIEVF